MELRRLHQEASQDWSLLLTSASRREELERLSASCKKDCKDTISFLLAYKTLCDHENDLFGRGEFASFSDRQKIILSRLQSSFMDHASHLSDILIATSAESLDGKVQLNGDEDVLGFAVNGITSRMVATGEFRLSMLARYPGNEEKLWLDLKYPLLDNGFSEVYLTEHRKIILAYVRALEKGSAYVGRADAQVIKECENMEKMRVTDTEIPDLHTGGESSTLSHESEEESTDNTPLSSKTSHSDEDESQEIHYPSKAELS